MASTKRRIHAAAVRLFTAKVGTQLTMSELANEAQVARGTLYRNIDSIEQLFDNVLAELCTELQERVSSSFTEDDDGATRIATGLRMTVRYGYQDPAVGRFMVRFALSEDSLRSVLTGPLMRDVRAGVAEGRFHIDGSMIMSAASHMIGALVSALSMVLEGHQTWRDAGSCAAELVLRAFGVDAAEAHKIATADLRALRPRHADDHSAPPRRSA
jgi:AcrR family transcriptional regulator